MANNPRLLCATTRTRVFDVVYSLTMPSTPEWVICGDFTRTLAHIFDVPGISVPISRGSPPIQTE